MSVQQSRATVGVTRDPPSGEPQSPLNRTWRRTCEPPLPPPAHTTTLVTSSHSFFKPYANTPCQHHDQHVNDNSSDSDFPLRHTRGPTQQVLQTVPEKPIQSIRPTVPLLPHGLERVHQELLQIVSQQKSSRESNQGPQQDLPHPPDPGAPGVPPPPPQAAQPRPRGLTGLQT